MTIETYQHLRIDPDWWLIQDCRGFACFSCGSFDGRYL